MKSKTTGELLSPIFKFARRIASALKDKPRSTLDEYVMEHILLYHGLVGTSPENHRKYRDVRADIIEAIQKNSSVELSIALKLPPLWWEDKLQTIVSELEGDSRNLAVSTLLPDSVDDDVPPAADPLRHDDWRVRANAANLLAFLKVDSAVPRLAAALDDAATGSTKPAFCHIAYALGRLRRDQATQALLPYLYSDEPWFRVDAARALSLWPADTVIADLMSAMLEDHPLSDYMAVVIAREHPPQRLLRHPDTRVAAGALEMIIGVIAATNQTHPKDTVLETGVLDCWADAFESYRQEPTPRRLRAARSIALWVRDNAPLAEGYIVETPPIADALTDLTSASNNDMLLQWLATDPGAGQSEAEGELRHAIHLAGELKVAGALPVLLTRLRPEHPLVDQVIDALGNVGDIKASEPLVKL